MNQPQQSLLSVIMRKLAMLLLAMAAAIFVRKVFLGALETRIVWVTFYPAVMVVALYGGWLMGFFSAGASCLIAIYAWPILAPRPFIKDFGDRLGMFAFLFNCVLISLVAESARRAKARAIEAKEQAEAASRAKSVFLASMSHELRTPLNAILGFSRMMSNTPAATADMKDNLGIITRSGEHLLNLINNVLDISKIEAGRVELEELNTDLYQLMEQIRSLMGVQAVEKGLRFLIEQSPEQPRYVTVDQGKLRQVLINLLGNAIKYTKSGEVILRVRGGSGAALAGGWLRFEVEDTGAGISPEDSARLFQPFVQVGSRSSTEGGTGLGLAISKQFVELMGGRIGVESEVGKGSLFYFQIPAAPGKGGEELLSGLGNRRVTALADDSPRSRILIVEDQPENRLLLHKLLEPLGLELREAVNGKEAVEICAAWHPDLIWMDIRMPVMDGMEASRRIKATEAGARTKIIALTAHALEEERREILAAGCDDFIRKPYQETEIFEAMARHLGLKYRYGGEAVAAGAPGGGGEALAVQLAAFPVALCRQLHQAVDELDTARTLELIEQCASLDAATARILKGLAVDFEYDRLQSLMESAVARLADGLPGEAA